MEVPPPLPPEILRKIQDAHLPPSAPLFPRALAFTADGILAGLLACLAVHLLASVFIPEEFPVFTETLQNVFHEYQEATQAAAQGDSARANAFVKNLPAQLETDAFQTSASFIALTSMLAAFAYFVLSESLTHGSSLGKKIFRLRVVSTLTGKPPRLIQTISRSLWRACSVAPAGILITLVVAANAHVPFFSYRRRAWHDKLAHTEVVDDK